MQNELILPLLTGLLTGGAAAAAITVGGKLIEKALDWRRECKAKKEDKQDSTDDRLAAIERRLRGIEQTQTTLTTQVNDLRVSDKAILSDRIKWLGQKYIEAGEVTFEDRRNLHDLHSAYHNHLGGNGDYDELMRDVDELPLKIH